MNLILEYQAQLLAGTWVTIQLALISLVFAVMFGLLGAWAKLSKNIVAQNTAVAYTTIVRGVPDLVLILLVLTMNAASVGFRVWLRQRRKW